MGPSLVVLAVVAAACSGDDADDGPDDGGTDTASESRSRSSTAQRSPRDDDNAEAGIRTPAVDVPVARLTGEQPGDTEFFLEPDVSAIVEQARAVDLTG